MTLTTIFLISLFLFSIVGAFKAFSECKKGNSYNNAHVYNLLGAFVWGDVVVFGTFWALASLIILYTKDITLFFLILSVFWVVRSFGEMIYWFNQQFSKVVRMKPEDLWFYKYFNNDSVWFVYQIYWQCVLVVSIIATIYFANNWIK